METPPEAGEFRIVDLVGCRVQGLGAVRRVLPGSSCDVLELDGGVLVPLITDAVVQVDVEGRRIEVNHTFLGLEEPS
jgi:ribosomal 30S subunit maturation factor RimM